MFEQKREMQKMESKNWALQKSRQIAKVLVKIYIF